MNALISLKRGRWFEAVISAVSIAPYIGDVSKLAKLPRYLNSIREAIHLARFNMEMTHELNWIFKDLKKLLEDVIEIGGDKLSDKSRQYLQQICDEIHFYLYPGAYHGKKSGGVGSGSKGAQSKTKESSQTQKEDLSTKDNGDGIGVKKIPKRDPSYRDDLDEKWFKKNGDLNWPKDDGFVELPHRLTLKKGEKIDRFSSETGVDDMGSFLSPAKTPYGERALPYDSSKMNHTEYEVVKEIEVNSGKAAPWFGEKGGGIQHQTDMSVGELVEDGFLREVKK